MMAVAAGAADPGDKTARVAHYINEDGTIGFVFDRSRRPPLLRFDDSQEILVLTSVPAPRGDTIYKRENGETVLRQTIFGGMTLFAADRPEGLPVMRDRAAAPLTLPLRFPDQVEKRATALAMELSALLGNTVAVEVDWERAPTEKAGLATLADAVEITGLALKRLGEDDMGREALAARVRRVVFVPAGKATANLSGDTLTVTYVWSDGVEGRLSSYALVTYLESVL